MTIQDRIGKFKQPNREWFTRNVNTIKKFSVHHDAIPQDNRTADQVMQQIMNIHVAKGWPGASYHYYIHRDGTVYQMNKHEWVTWIDGINYDAIGIVLNGYFHTPNNNQLTPAQLQALKELLDELSNNHPEFPAGEKDTMAHRERAQTACPGDKAYPYVKEYREKEGNVDWGTTVPPVPPTPTPPTQPITAQTKIPAGLLNSEHFAVTQDMEVQQIKSNLNDLSKQKKEVEDKLNQIKSIVG